MNQNESTLLGSWDFNAREMTPLIEARRSSLGGSRHPSRSLGTSWNYEVNDEQTGALTIPPPPPESLVLVCILE
eukprot:scaffold1036_cov135-Skeletonema_dohrnii-CCMP3373.AAC.10